MKRPENDSNPHSDLPESYLDVLDHELFAQEELGERPAVSSGALAWELEVGFVPDDVVAGGAE